MADNQGGTHADEDLFTVELTANQLFCFLRNRHQSVDKQLRNTRYQLHNGTHNDSQSKHILHDTHRGGRYSGVCLLKFLQIAAEIGDMAGLTKQSYQSTYNDSEHKRVA